MNECLTDNGGCDQICEDTTVAFECRCGQGYTLNANGHSCDGNNHNEVINIGTTPKKTNTTPIKLHLQGEKNFEKRDTFSVFLCSLEIAATLTSCYAQCLRRTAYVGTCTCNESETVNAAYHSSAYMYSWYNMKLKPICHVAVLLILLQHLLIWFL